ncbi:hypothetical protein [Desulfohalovibrio reitneri]|jgi:F0F1-type ATP synthase assembly protein I|uniref:hypothetical protein n=1 Tax=Desulfohalovibrio reitneri TaxID=1307759 RepID=UPI000B150790|nr:hypothetical protein [Desulfohalovibrio reitneri]
MSKPKTILDFVARGILIGGALGVLAGMFVLTIQRGLFLGMLVGALAGLTLYNRRN